jgi:hypothetical protein
MRPRMLEQVVGDYEYRQRVRRYRPSSLVPLVAAAAAGAGGSGTGSRARIASTCRGRWRTRPASRSPAGLSTTGRRLPTGTCCRSSST